MQFTHSIFIFFIYLLFSTGTQKNECRVVSNGPAISITKKCDLPTRLSSSSGLCFVNGKCFTFNDSGNTPDLFQIDTATGTILQTIHINNYPNIDWEDITADKNYIYIGDFGNNKGIRTNLRVLKIPISSIPNHQLNVAVNADAINFKYTDQNSFMKNEKNNFDCEAMVSIDSSLYLFTKNRGDENTRLYTLSKAPGNYNISPITTYNSKGKITGADYCANTKQLVLIGYEDKKLNSFLLFFTNFNGRNLNTSNASRVTIGNSFNKWQTEGICYVTPTHLLISCETTKHQNAALFATNL